jgi:hypothetical protein
MDIVYLSFNYYNDLLNDVIFPKHDNLCLQFARVTAAIHEHAQPSFK